MQLILKTNKIQNFDLGDNLRAWGKKNKFKVESEKAERALEVSFLRKDHLPLEDFDVAKRGLWSMISVSALCWTCSPRPAAALQPRS